MREMEARTGDNIRGRNLEGRNQTSVSDTQRYGNKWGILTDRWIEPARHCVTDSSIAPDVVVRKDVPFLVNRELKPTVCTGLLNTK